MEVAAVMGASGYKAVMAYAQRELDTSKLDMFVAIDCQGRGHQAPCLDGNGIKLDMANEAVGQVWVPKPRGGPCRADGREKENLRAGFVRVAAGTLANQQSERSKWERIFL